MTVDHLLQDCSGVSFFVFCFCCCPVTNVLLYTNLTFCFLLECAASLEFPTLLLFQKFLSSFEILQIFLYCRNVCIFYYSFRLLMNVVNSDIINNLIEIKCHTNEIMVRS